MPTGRSTAAQIVRVATSTAIVRSARTGIPLSSSTSTSIGVESICTCSPGLAANVGVNTPCGRFAVCRSRHRRPERMPTRRDCVDHLVERRLARQRHHPDAVLGLELLHHPADQPRPRPGRCVRLGADQFAHRRHQPCVQRDRSRRTPRPPAGRPGPIGLAGINGPGDLHRPHADPQLNRLDTVPLSHRCAHRVEPRPRFNARRRPGASPISTSTICRSHSRASSTPWSATRPTARTVPPPATARRPSPRTPACHQVRDEHHHFASVSPNAAAPMCQPTPRPVVGAVEAHPVTRPQHRCPSQAHRSPSQREPGCAVQRYRQIHNQFLAPQQMEHHRHAATGSPRFRPPRPTGSAPRSAPQQICRIRYAVSRMPVARQPPKIPRHDRVAGADQPELPPPIRRLSRSRRTSPCPVARGVPPAGSPPRAPTRPPGGRSSPVMPDPLARVVRPGQPERLRCDPPPRRRSPTPADGRAQTTTRNRHGHPSSPTTTGRSDALPLPGGEPAHRTAGLQRHRPRRGQWQSALGTALGHIDDLEIGNRGLISRSGLAR